MNQIKLSPSDTWDYVDFGGFGKARTGWGLKGRGRVGEGSG
jgi:hypothetical protein